MSARFAGKWEKGTDKRSLITRIKEGVRPPGQLKPRLDYAIKRINIQIQKLDKATDRFSQRDKFIFAKIVDAYSKHDTTRAQVFATELAQLRKMEQMIMHARLALEQIILRLSTVSELGDVVSTLAPTVGVMRSVRNNMTAIFPEAERELGNIGNLLSGIVVDAGQTTGMNIDFQTASDDSQKILNEAATVAEQKVKKRFPELPSGALQGRLGEATQTKT
ncbi:MAG: Snf7 family protein [Candidatus Bathyarchaeota archaeon]